MKTLRQIAIEEQQAKVKEWYTSKPMEFTSTLDYDFLMYLVEELHEHYMDRNYYSCTNLNFFFENEEWIKLLYPEVQSYVLDKVLYICMDKDAKVLLSSVLKRRVVDKLDYVNDAIAIINKLSFVSKLG